MEERKRKAAITYVTRPTKTRNHGHVYMQSRVNLVKLDVKQQARPTVTLHTVWFGV